MLKEKNVMKPNHIPCKSVLSFSMQRADIAVSLTQIHV